MRFARPFLSITSLWLTLAALAGAQDRVLFDAWLQRGALFKAESGTLGIATNAGEPVLRWQPEPGQEAVLEIPADSPLLEQMKSMDWLNLEFRIVSGRINDLGFAMRGLVSGHRRYKVHSTGLAHGTTTQGEWHSRQLELSRPNWFPWDNPDGDGADTFFRFSTLALEPDTVIEFRRISAHTGWLQLKPDFELPVTWPFPTVREDGAVSYRIGWQLLNASGKSDTLSATLLSTHEKFKVGFVTNDVETRVGGNGSAIPFELTAVISAEDARKAPPLYAEPLRVKFSLRNRPDVAVFWDGWLVAPLPAGTRRQVVFSEADLVEARLAASNPTGALARALDVARIRARADDFRSKALLQIPTGHQWPGTTPPREWQVTGIMCQISNTVTHATEFNSHLAGLVWKKYLEYPGFAAENLGQAYLFSGDEGYAAQAVAYFTLMGAQYPLLPLNKAYELSWAGGPATLSASRWANGSTYSGSMFMRTQSRLLNMVSESPAWTDSQRALVYANFAVPYCLEVMKFNGGMNNQTDIGNHNVLLMGLAFQDAGMVRWALQHDGGVLSRLYDIDPDGFSSEGRPVSYQLAGMAEYLPALAYLKNSGLDLPVAWGRLLAAFRMPFLRAGLNGRIPNTGDCARWQQAGLNPHVDYVAAFFPEEKWLDMIAGGTTPAMKIRRFKQGGATPDKEQWRTLLSAKPHLFSHAGMALLRTGETPETQIMATLDYGLNIYHGHLDRLQVTLMAFGRTFTHGYGSVYNVGAGGMTKGPAELRDVPWNSSLFQNVILVDQQSQRPAVGKLLAWSGQPEKQVAVARVDGIRPGVSHTRGVVLTHGVVIVLDRVESDQPHQYDWVYHNFGDLTLGAGWTAAPQPEPLGSSKSVGYPTIQELRVLTGEGPLALDWDLTRQIDDPVKRTNAPSAWSPVHLDFRQVCSESGRLSTGITGLNNPNTKTVWDRAPSVFHRVEGRTASWATVLAPYGAETPVAAIARDGRDGLSVTLRNGTVLRADLQELIRAHAYRAPGTPD